MSAIGDSAPARKMACPCPCTNPDRMIRLTEGLMPIQCECRDCGPTVDGEQRCMITIHPIKAAFNGPFCGECVEHGLLKREKATHLKSTEETFARSATPPSTKKRAASEVTGCSGNKKSTLDMSQYHIRLELRSILAFPQCRTYSMEPKF